MTYLYVNKVRRVFTQDTCNRDHDSPDTCVVGLVVCIFRSDNNESMIFMFAKWDVPAKNSKQMRFKTQFFNKQLEMKQFKSFTEKVEIGA